MKAMKMNLITLILITLLLISQTIQKCGFSHEHQMNVKVQKIDVSSNSLRFLQSTTWSPIRIYVDYTQLESQTSTLSAATITNIKAVLNKVVATYSILLSVKPLTTPLKISSCHTSNMISDAVKSGVAADLVVFPFVDTTASATIEAYAAYCVTHLATGRPLAGYVGFGNALDFTKKNAMYYLELLVLHEVNHILSFNSGLFGNYIEANGDTIPLASTVISQTVNGLLRQMIVTPKVLAAARKHFNCPTMLGVELENQGGDGTAGSHWEERVMAGDYMIGESYQENVISPMTLALLEDSGWYTVNHYDAGLFRYGKNEGCNFLLTKCVSNGSTAFPKEFSVKIGAQMCFTGGSAKGYSSAQTSKIIDANYQYFTDKTEGGNEYADYCPIAQNGDDSGWFFSPSCWFGRTDTYPAGLGETIGGDSNCFVSSLVPQDDNSVQNLKGQTNAICYKVTCNNANLTYSVSIGTSTVVCPSAGGIITVNGFYGEINCVEYNQVCTKSASCADVFDCVAKKVTGLTANYSYATTTTTTTPTTTTTTSSASSSTTPTTSTTPTSTTPSTTPTTPTTTTTTTPTATSSGTTSTSNTSTTSSDTTSTTTPTNSSGSTTPTSTSPTTSTTSTTSTPTTTTNTTPTITTSTSTTTNGTGTLSNDTIIGPNIDSATNNQTISTSTMSSSSLTMLLDNKIVLFNLLVFILF